MKNKSFEFEKNGLKELSDTQCMENTGGSFPWFVSGAAGILGYLAKQCIDDWQCFKDGLAGNPSTHGVSHSK